MLLKVPRSYFVDGIKGAFGGVCVLRHKSKVLCKDLGAGTGPVSEGEKEQVAAIADEMDQIAELLYKLAGRERGQ